MEALSWAACVAIVGAPRMSHHEVVNQLSHRLRVMRMYRWGMRELLNWSMSRQAAGVCMHEMQRMNALALNPGD